MITLEGFIERFNSYMRTQGFSNTELAEKVGCSQTYISYLCSGKRNPSNTFLKKLEKVSGKKTSFWLHGEEEYEGLLALNEFLNMLVAYDLVEDVDEMDDDTLNMIIRLAKSELKKKLSEKNRE